MRIAAPGTKKSSINVTHSKICTHYWIQVLCRVPEALGKGQIALGKGQIALGKKLIGKALFAKCILSGTRQRKATVTAPGSLTVTLSSGNPAGTRQRFFYFFLKKILCRVPSAIGKAGKMVFRAPIFSALQSAVTMALGNRVLCRVQHLAK